VHGFGGMKEPEALLEKVTMPVGKVGVGEVSVTVAVHVVAWLTATEVGKQLTLVEVVAGTGASEITDTVLAPLFRMKTVFVKESTAAPTGEASTGNEPMCMLVMRSITRTSLRPLMGTNRWFVLGFALTALAQQPGRGLVVITVLVAPSIMSRSGQPGLHAYIWLRVGLTPSTLRPGMVSIIVFVNPSMTRMSFEASA